jgi:hypothetical protein
MELEFPPVPSMLLPALITVAERPTTSRRRRTLKNRILLAIESRTGDWINSHFSLVIARSQSH